jgi:5-formyltetrahydrofolate cyclo-ligase
MDEPLTATPAKAALRRQVLARRDAIGAEARAEASVAICAAAADLIAARHPAVVAGYWPIRSEVDCRPLLEKLLADGVAVALPVVTGDHAILFRRWHRGDALAPAGFGTLGPSAAAAEAVPDVVVMPLAGFDTAGHRLGYGKGHYDRALARLRSAGGRPYLVGLAFADQQVAPIPFEDHDIRLDMVVTERGLRSLGETG